MSNPVLLHLPLRENLEGRDRNGVVTATASGPVRFTSDGYYAEEGTTNHARNPSAENTIAANTGGFFDGWAASGAGTTVNRVLTNPFAGSACIEVVCDGSVAPQGGNFYANLAGDYAALTSYTVTPSVAVRGSGVFRIDVAVYYTDSSNTNHPGSDITVPDDGEWHRYTLPTVTTDGAKTVNYIVGQVRTKAARATTFWLDASQFERKAYATSYADGSMGTGYSWTGTAHNSASTRAASSLSVVSTNRIDGERGSAVLRFNAPDLTNAAVLLNAGTFGTDDWLQANINFAATGNPPRLLAKTDAGATNTLVGTAATEGDTDEMFYAEWTATTLGVTLGAETLTSGVRTGPPDDVITGPILIGTSGSAQYPNGYISDVLIFDRPLTDAERAYLAATPEWSFGVLQPKVGGLLRIGMGLGLAMSHAVLATDPIALLRGGGGE